MSPRPLLVAALLALAVPAAASAATTDVSTSSQFSSAAQNAATGDTIHVLPGIYQANIAVGNAGVTIQADPGAILLNTADATGPTLSFASTSNTSPDVLRGLNVLNTVASGQPAVSVGGSGLLMQRALALSVKGDAVSSVSNDSAPVRTITIDSSMLFPGASGAGIHVTATSLAVTPAGAVTVNARHITDVGANAVILDNSGANGLLLPPPGTPSGNITATINDSILLGKQTTSTNTSQLSAPNTATIGGARNLTAGSPAAIFVNPGRGNYHLRADSPAIGHGGFTDGESTTDIDGDAIPAGNSDQGADQFVNRPPTAALAAVTGTVRQNRPVTFDASGSRDPDAGIGGGIVAYHWDFGDGTKVDTTTPTTTHSYSAKQPYSVTVTVTDKQGATSAPSAADTFTVIDGVAPTVTVAAPTAKQKIRLYRVRKGKHGKVIRTHRRLSVSFLGTGQDDVALDKVVIALRPIASKNGVCRWFDGASALKSASCLAPIALTPTLINGGWRYVLPRSAKLPLGVYQLYVSALDASGLASAPTIVTFRFV